MLISEPLGLLVALYGMLSPIARSHMFTRRARAPVLLSSKVLAELPGARA